MFFSQSPLQCQLGPPYLLLHDSVSHGEFDSLLHHVWKMKLMFHVHVWIMVWKVIDFALLMIRRYGVRPLVPSSAPFVPVLSPHKADIGLITVLLLL